MTIRITAYGFEVQQQNGDVEMVAFSESVHPIYDLIMDTNSIGDETK